MENSKFRSFKFCLKMTFCRTTQVKLQELKEIELMPHPVQSPNLVCFFFFFGLLLVPVHGSRLVLIVLQQLRERGKLQFESSSLPRKKKQKKTGISVGSKNCRKGDFHRCSTMASILNAWLLLFLFEE